jgi:DNA-binding NtrC family response regulator
VRVVCATNHNLRDEVAAGRFREDLYFRLNVIPVTVAPLRERREDIVPLARHFLAAGASLSGRSLRLSSAAEQVLLQYQWSGNVRELENVMERVIVMVQGEEVSPNDLMLDGALIRPLADEVGPNNETDSYSSSMPAPQLTEGAEELEYTTLDETLDIAIAKRLKEAIERAHGNRSEAAKMLGLNRTKFYRLLRRIEQQPR